MKVRVQSFWRNSKSAENFHRKKSEIRVPAKECTNSNQQSRVDWRHDYKGANAISPWAVAEGAFDSQNFAHGRAHQLHPILNIQGE